MGSITWFWPSAEQLAPARRSPARPGLAASNGAPEATIPALAAELKPIRVDAVSPGVTHTPWWHGLPDAERAALFAQSASATSVERIGSADDVARAIVSLIDNDFITGTIVTVTAGSRSAPPPE